MYVAYFVETTVIQMSNCLPVLKPKKVVLYTTLELFIVIMHLSPVELPLVYPAEPA